MYFVKSGEHFEDWYVALIEDSFFDSFDQALRWFQDNCVNVINDPSSGSGIEQYIAENHHDENADDPSWVEDYSKGFFFRLELDDVELLSLHFAYQTRNHTISPEMELELNERSLTATEIAKIQKVLSLINNNLFRFD